MIRLFPALLLQLEIAGPAEGRRDGRRVCAQCIQAANPMAGAGLREQRGWDEGQGEVRRPKNPKGSRPS